MAGLIRIQSDFGAGEGPPPDPPPSPPDELEQARSELEQVIALQDDARYVNRDDNPAFAWDEIGEASRIAAIVRERLAPKVSPPPVVPPPVVPPPRRIVKAVAIQYGTQHAPALDVYGGYDDDQVQYGIHWGLPFYAPADGTVSIYSFGTPLALLQAMDAEYQANHAALFGGFICGMPADQLHTLAQTMYFVLYVPDRPISTRYGVMKAGWVGHSRGNAKVGRVLKDAWFGESWDSGVHFESVGIAARASHGHFAASATGALTMNGDISGLAMAEAIGWQITAQLTGPGPDEYLSGAWVAGRRRSDFTAAGRPLPPMPA